MPRPWWPWCPWCPPKPGGLLPLPLGTLLVDLIISRYWQRQRVITACTWPFSKLLQLLHLCCSQAPQPMSMINSQQFFVQNNTAHTQKFVFKITFNVFFFKLIKVGSHNRSHLLDTFAEDLIPPWDLTGHWSCPKKTFVIWREIKNKGFTFVFSSEKPHLVAKYLSLWPPVTEDTNFCH